MDLPEIILAVIAVITSAGGGAAWFARSRGTNTIKLLQVNIDAYKDSERLKDAKILVLQNQLELKEDIIARLIKDGKKKQD